MEDGRGKEFGLVRDEEEWPDDKWTVPAVILDQHGIVRPGIVYAIGGITVGQEIEQILLGNKKHTGIVLCSSW